MTEGICIICGRHFARRGCSKTCSEECSKIRKKQCADNYRKEKRNKANNSTLLTIEQKARKMGLSYGKYMAWKRGEIEIDETT